MEKKEMIKKERLLMLQNFAETYLRANNMPPSKQLFKDSVDKYGELNDQQAAILHLYLEDSYKKMGFDLKKAIEDSGETYVEGKLSKYELDELIRRADEMIIFLGVLKLRKDALYNK